MRALDIANILSVRPETVLRWNQGKASPHPQTERLLMELCFVVERMADLYEPEEARLWISSRQHGLNGAVPADLIRADRAEEVLKVNSKLYARTL